MNVPDSDGYTPLYYACAKGHLDKVTFLVEQEADVNDDRFNPLMASVAYGHKGVTAYLLQHGKSTSPQGKI